MVKVTAAQDIRDLVQRIRKHSEEERELVRVFFGDIVEPPHGGHDSN